MMLRNKFNKQFGSLITKYGDTIKIYSGKSDCPNCGYDPIARKSNGIYNTNNPYPAHSEYNRPFNRGMVCPVCGGTGKILTYEEIPALVYWMNRNYDEKDSVRANANIVRIKTYSRYYTKLNKHDEIFIPTVNGNELKCKRISTVTPFGLGQDNFIKFDCEIIE